MRQKTTFADVTMKAFQLIEKDGKMLDVDLMIRLDFTPPSWKVWKPKLIQKLTNFPLPKTEAESGDYTKVRIKYHKKEDVWESEEFLE